MKIAVCIGHSRTGDDGAESVTGVTEWDFNSELGSLLVRKLRDANFDAELFDRYDGNGYTAAMRDAARQVKNYGASIAIELHFNAGGATAEGFEYLYYLSSTKGMKLAEELLDAQHEHFPQARNRGIKTPMDGRGDGFLKYTHCPAVICEPFFGTNKSEWDLYSHSQDKLADSYVSGITNYFLA